MKYLRNIFENVNNKEHINFIKEEKANINDILYDLKDIGISIEISYAISLISEFEYESYINLEEIDYDNEIYLCGYIIVINNMYDIFENVLDTYKLDSYIESMEIVSNTMKSINSLIETDSYFIINEDNRNKLYFVKKNPTEEDYYYIFGEILTYYIDESKKFSNFELYKKGSDYYIDFNLLEDEPEPKKQIKQLKDFCSDYFEEISYDSYHKINNSNFRIKNPKIKSIKF